MPIRSFICRLATRWACILLFSLAVIPAQAKRHDIVIMKNGDHLTGEVKKLESGVLYVDLDYVSGSVGLDWSQVEKVQSGGNYQIVLNNGDRLSGSIEKKPESEAPGKDVEITSSNGVVQASQSDIAQIETQKRNFWRQLTGSLDFGYDFTSGNDQSTLTGDASALYAATRWDAGASFTSSFSGQSSASKSNLQELQLLGDRFLNSRNSFVLGLGDFLHSSQQDLNLRTTAGGAYGRYFIRTQKDQLRWFGGAVFTNESYQSVTSHPNDQNVEALLGVTYETYRFDRYDLQSQVFVYPGLSDAGRVRMTTKTTFTMKLSNNFYSNVNFWDNFDSRPPVSSKKNDLGISSGLGWTF
jgi:putative salt-induced outer membrane protein YdiY